MMYKKKITICSEIYTKQINVEFLNVKPGGK
jgi:hypothetical protein